jgi:hypothetical protein
MLRYCGILIVALFILLSGCTALQGRPDLSQEELDKIRDGIREFMEDPGFSVEMNNISQEKNLLLVTSNQSAFLVSPTDYRVAGAEFTGQDSILPVTKTTLHTRAIEGIRAFFRNETFSPEISRLHYYDDRYEIEGPGMFFRVNATTGTVVTLRLQGEETVRALNQSDQFTGAREALNVTF